MRELSVCMLKRYFVPFFVNTCEQLISKSLLQKKMGKAKRQPTSIDFLSIYDFFTIFNFYNIQNSLKNIKGCIKGVFRAILLLQRERLKEMWSNKVAKTKRKHISIDFFHLQFFYDF